MSTEKPTCCSDTPAIFFRGQYSFRSFNCAAGVLLTFVFSAMFVFAAASFPWSFGCFIFVFIALGLGGVGMRMLWGWIHKESTYIEINEHGIVSGKRFWSWKQVHSFHGTSYANGVRLDFMTRKITYGFYAGGNLSTTPLLTKNQYVDLAKKMSHYLATEYPNVVVDPLPRPCSND